MLIRNGYQEGRTRQPAFPSLELRVLTLPGARVRAPLSPAAASAVLSAVPARLLGSPPRVLTSLPTPPSPSAFPVLLSAVLKPLPLARFPKTLLVVIHPPHPQLSAKDPWWGCGGGDGVGTSQDEPEGDNSLCPSHLLLEAGFLTCYGDSSGVKVHPATT